MLSSSTYDSLAHTYESLGGLLGEWALRRSLRGPPSESSSSSAPPLPPPSSSHHHTAHDYDDRQYPINSSQSAASSSQGGLVDSWITFVRNRIVVVCQEETSPTGTGGASSSSSAVASLGNLLAPLLIAPSPSHHHNHQHSSADDHTTDDDSHTGVLCGRGGCRLAGVDDDPSPSSSSPSSQLATTLCVLMLSMVKKLPSPDAIGLEGVELLHSLQEELYEQLCEMVMGESTEDGVVPLTVAWQMVVCASVVALYVYDERGDVTPTSSPPSSHNHHNPPAVRGGVDLVANLLEKAISTLGNPTAPSSPFSPYPVPSSAVAEKGEDVRETYTTNFLKYETIGESLLFETADQGGDCFPCATTPQSQPPIPHSNPLQTLMPVLGALERAVGCLTEDQLTVSILILECLGDPPPPPHSRNDITMMGVGVSTSFPPSVPRAHLRTLRVTKLCGGSKGSSSRGKDIRITAIKDKISKWNVAATLWGYVDGCKGGPPSSARVSGMKRSRPCVVHSSCGSDNTATTTTTTATRAAVVAEEAILGASLGDGDDEEASIFGKVRRVEGMSGSAHHQASHPQASALLFSSSSSLLPPPSPTDLLPHIVGVEVGDSRSTPSSGVPATSRQTSSITTSPIDGLLSAISQAHEEGEELAAKKRTTTAVHPHHHHDHPPSQPSDAHCTPSSIEDCTTQSNLTITQRSTTSSRYINTSSQDSLSQAGPPLPFSSGYVGLSRGQLSIISTAADVFPDDSSSNHPHYHLKQSLLDAASNTLSAASLGNISVNTAAPPPPPSRRHHHDDASHTRKHNTIPATSTTVSPQGGHIAAPPPPLPPHSSSSSPTTTSQPPPLVDALSQLTQMVLSPHIPSPTTSHTGTVVSNAATEQLLCYLRQAGRASAASTTTASSSQPLRVSINVGKDHTNGGGGGGMGSTPLTVTTTHTTATTDSARPSGGRPSSLAGRWSSDDDRAVSSGLGSCRIGSTTATKSGRGSSSVHPSPPQHIPPHSNAAATRSVSAVLATQHQQHESTIAAAAAGGGAATGAPLPLVPTNVSHLTREELEDRLRDAEGCIRLLGAQVRDSTHQQQQLTESVSHLQGWLQETWEGMRLTTIAVLEHLQQQQQQQHHHQ